MVPQLQFSKKIVDDDNYHVLFKKKSNSRKRTNKEESTRKGVFYFGPQNGLWCEAMIKLYALSKNLIPFLPHLQLTYLVAIIVTKYWIMSYQWCTCVCHWYPIQSMLAIFIRPSKRIFYCTHNLLVPTINQM